MCHEAFRKNFLNVQLYRCWMKAAFDKASREKHLFCFYHENETHSGKFKQLHGRKLKTINCSLSKGNLNETLAIPSTSLIRCCTMKSGWLVHNSNTCFLWMEAVWEKKAQSFLIAPRIDLLMFAGLIRHLNKRSREESIVNIPISAISCS